MAKLELKEMYLTEYNRLVKALQDHYTALQSYSTIAEMTDWLNANLNNTEITQINLNSINFTSDEKDTKFNYTRGGKTIEIIKHDGLKASNIKQGVTIEGIRGTLADASGMVAPDNLTQTLSLVDKNVTYWYLDSISNTVKSTAGMANLLTDDVLSGMEYDDTNEVFQFSETDLTRKANYYRNFKISVDKGTITPNAENTEWTISAGYHPEDITIEKLTTAEKNTLKNYLQYDYTFLGVTGVDPMIRNTQILEATNNSNHIIAGQTYWRNGEQVSGSLAALNESNLQKSGVTDEYDNSFTPTVSATGKTYLTIPNNKYSNKDWYFDITDLKPENIKSTATIMGIEGEAEIYEFYDEDGYNIELGVDFPEKLPTTDRTLVNDISFTLSSDFVADSIRYGKKLLGVEGIFTKNDGSLDYVTHDGEKHEGQVNPGTPSEKTIQYYETADLRQGKYAFIDGELCRGTNNNFFDVYEGNYTIKLGATLPEALPTERKSLTDDIRFELDTDVVKPENVVYGKTILGVNGSFSECTTNPIIAEKIAIGYTGFVNGAQIEGTMKTIENESLDSSMEGYTLDDAYYSGVNINPLRMEYLGVIYSLNSETGRNTLAGCLRQNSAIFDNKGVRIDGTGRTVYNAINAEQADTILETIGSVNEILHYTGTTEDDGFKPNTYWEIVHINDPGLPGITVPGFDRLFRARELIATATADDIVRGKTAFGTNGIEITGNIETMADKYTLTLTADDDRWDDPRFPAYTVLTPIFYKKGWTVQLNKNTINANHIKAGEKIFGVTGTYTPTLKTQTFTENNTYKASDEGVDGYSEVTVNVPIGAKSETIIVNGTYDTPITDDGLQGWNSIKVAIPYDGEIELTPDKISKSYTFGVGGAGDTNHVAWTKITVKAPALEKLTIKNLASESISSYNKTYTPTGSNVGFSSVEVKLTPKLYTGTITTNGDHSVPAGYDGYGAIKVNVGSSLTERTLNWNDIKSKTTIAPTPGSGYDGYSEINFDSTLKFEDYQFTYDDLYKTKISPTSCTAFTGINVGITPQTCVLTVDDVIKGGIVESMTKKVIWNQVEIPNIIETQDAVQIYMNNQKIESSEGKLFKSVEITYDTISCEIGTGDLFADQPLTRHITDYPLGPIGFNNVKVNIKKQEKLIIDTELLSGQATTFTAPDGVLWDKVTVPPLPVIDYSEANATINDIAFGKKAVLADGQVNTGIMAPTIVSNSLLQDNDILCATAVGSYKNFIFETEPVANNTPHLRLINTTNSSQSVFQLSRTYWDWDNGNDTEYVNEVYHPGMVSHNFTPNSKITAYVSTTGLVSTKSVATGYNWVWKSRSRWLKDSLDTIPDSLPIGERISIYTASDVPGMPVGAYNASVQIDSGRSVQVFYRKSSSSSEQQYMLYLNGKLQYTNIGATNSGLGLSWLLSKYYYEPKECSLINYISDNYLTFKYTYYKSDFDKYGANYTCTSLLAIKPVNDGYNNTYRVSDINNYWYKEADKGNITQIGIVNTHGKQLDIGFYYEIPYLYYTITTANYNKMTEGVPYELELEVRFP